MTFSDIIFSFLFLFFRHKQLCVMVFINFVLCCLPLFSAELGAVVLLLSTFQKVQHIPYFLREEFGSKISRLPWGDYIKVVKFEIIHFLSESYNEKSDTNINSAVIRTELKPGVD